MLQTQPSSIVNDVRQFEGVVRVKSTEQLRLHAEVVRELVLQDGPMSHEAMTQGFAVMAEALHRVLRVELYDVQLMAAIVLCQGGVAEMQTGEGKTFSCAPAAFVHALTGRGVHVVTPNPYLAQRDAELLTPAFELLGLRVGLLPERAEASAKQSVYACDITYGTANDFGFDYLRDQLMLRQAVGKRLGQTLLERLEGSAEVRETRMQRELAYAIVDEIDNVLLDDAVSPLVLSDAADGEAADAAVHRLACDVAASLRESEDYRIHSTSGLVRLTKSGTARVHDPAIAIPIDQLRRTWTEYVEQALHVRVAMRRDVHYVVDEGKIQIVDGSTGRIFSDRSWRAGMHQAVEAKEGVTITPEKHVLAQITRQRYYRLYRCLAGMTGTATGCEREFRHVYRLRVHSIPLRVPSQRVTLPTRYFANASAKRQAIADTVHEIRRTGRPVLIGTKSIADSERLAEVLERRALPFRILNGRQDEQEATIVEQAGDPFAITIATNLAGRGTDIPLALGVAERGGLHVIVAECHESARIDRQLIGRCARQGDPGSAQIFVSADDDLIQRYGPWLARFLQRYSDEQGEVYADLSQHIQRLQEAAERSSYATRCALLRQDLASEKLWTRGRDAFA